MKNFLVFILKVSISILLLIFLFRRIDFRATIFYVKNVEPIYFLYAVAIFVFVDFLGLMRWAALLKILKKDLPLSRIFVSFCGGLFFNTFLPSSIGGDLARTLDLSLHTKNVSSTLATVLLDRLFGFLGLVLVAFLAFFYSYFLGLTKDFRLLFFIIALAIIVIISFLILFTKRAFSFIDKIIFFKSLRNLFTKLHDSCFVFRFQKKVLVKVLILSILIQSLCCLVLYFIGLSLRININVIYYLIFIPIVTTVAMLPFSIGGLGLRDNAAVILFSTLGVAADKVAAMTLLNFIFLVFIGLIGGGIYGIALYNRRIQRYK